MHFFYWNKRHTVKAAFRLLCILIPQRSQSPWSTLRKALSVPQLLHSGRRDKLLRSTSKTTSPNLPTKLLIRLLPAHVGATQRGEPKPQSRVVTKAQQGTASHRFWSSTAAAGQRGPVLHVEHTQNSPLFLFICSYPPGDFCFHSVPLDFLPHLGNGTINDCKYNLTHLWWSILEIIIKYMPDFLLSSPILLLNSTPRFAFFSLLEFCFL